MIPTPTDQPALPPKNKSKVEILAEIKKLLEKNGLTISDEILIGLVESFKVQGMTLSRRINLLELQQIQPINDIQKILVFPRGKHWIEQYKEWLNYDDKFFENVAKNFSDPALNKPYIDVDHDYAESRGEVLNYEINDEGMFWLIRLNEVGRELVKKGLYKYISPSFGDVTDTTKKEHEDWMVTISLTNNPAFLGVIPALQEQMQLSRKSENGGKRNMRNELAFKKLGQFVELQGEYDPAVVETALPEIVALIEKLNEQIIALKGDVAAGEAVVEENAQAMATLSKEYKTIKDAQLSTEWDGVIKSAIKGGYPVSEDVIELKRKDFFENPEKVKKELSYFKSVEGEQQSSNTHSNNTELSADDKFIMDSTGWDRGDPKAVKEWIKLNKEGK